MDKTENMICLSRRGNIIVFLMALAIFFGFVTFAQAVNLPETGQTTCYSP